MASAEPLIERLLQLRRCAIVGPHGSGKSSLLAFLREPLRVRFEDRLHWWRFPMEGPAAAPLASLWAALGSWSQADLLVVDGYEQLSTFRRIQLRRQARRQRFALCVTCHRQPRGVASLYETTPTLQTVRDLVTDLLVAHPDLQLDYDQRVRERWESLPHRARGNVRELLFQLYDDFEQQRATRGGWRPLAPAIASLKDPPFDR